MRYFVSVNGEDREVAVDGSTFRLGDVEGEAHILEIEGTPVKLVEVVGRVYRVLARRGDAVGRYTIRLAGYRLEVEALDERTRAIRRISGSRARSSGPASIAAPMPGLVVRVLVQPGDPVQAGQGVIVIEAMKMENELRAPASGVVRTVAVTPGSAVEKGAILVEFDPAR